MNRGILLIFLLVTEVIFSQSYPDESLLYSRSGIGGTARTAGSAGAYGSVGADIGSININPAGLGLFRTSDISVTGGLKVDNNEAVLDGSHATAKDVKPYLAQFGAVWAIIPKAESQNADGSSNFRPVRSFAFSFNYQRENFFSRTQNFVNTNNDHSMMDKYTYYLNRTLGTPLTSDYYPPEMVWAYESNLIQLNPVTQTYFSNVKAPVIQQGTIQTKGGTDKINLGFGGNVFDKIYFGFNIGVPILNYGVNSIYGETNASSSGGFQNYLINSQLNVTGVGFTSNLGLIYRPAPWVRLGLAYQLPTWYHLSETYSINMSMNFDTANYVAGPASYQQPEVYNYRAPMKGTASASFYYKTFGFLSFDYEFQNLGAAAFHFANDSFGYSDTVNNNIKSTYKYSHTIRVGLEGSIKIMRLRAGYSYSTSPDKSGQVPQPGYPDYRHYVTAGIGVRIKGFYADFAYIMGFNKDASFPFASDPITNTNINHTMLLTLGWKIGKRQKSNDNPDNNTYKRRRIAPSAPPGMEDQKY